MLIPLQIRTRMSYENKVQPKSDCKIRPESLNNNWPKDLYETRLNGQHVYREIYKPRLAWIYLRVEYQEEANKQIYVMLCMQEIENWPKYEKLLTPLL